MTEKQCTKCKIVKSIDSFYKRKDAKIGVTSRCKQCLSEAHKVQGKKWREKNPDHHRNYVKQNPQTAYQRTYYSKKAGMNIETSYFEEFEKRWIEQDGKCAICKVVMIRGTKGGASLDHCHKTGKLRAILCMKCNTGIGMLNDDPELLMIAYNYLSGYEE